MAQMTKEQEAMMADVIATTERHIAELEADSLGGFVIILSGTRVLSAAKGLGDDRYNFAAMSIDAATWGHWGAMNMRDHFRRNGTACDVMGRKEYVAKRLASARESLAFYHQSLADFAAK